MRKLILLLPLCLMLGGCWDQQPIEQLGFVAMVGVDGTPGHIHMFARTVIPENLPSSMSPSASGNRSAGVTTYEGTGPDLYMASKAAGGHSPKRLYFGQLQAIIVSESLASAGDLGDILDNYVRHAKCRNLAWVYLATSADLPLIMQTAPMNANYPGEALDNLSLAEHLQGGTLPRRTFEVVDRLMSPGQDLSLPRLTVRDKNFALDGADIFQGQRLVGHLDAAASRTLALLQARVPLSSLSIPCQARGSVAVDLTSPHPHIGTQVAHGRVQSLWVDLHTSLNIKQMSSCPGDLSTSAFQKEIASATAVRLVELSTRMMQGLQANGSDVLGFGEQLREHEPTVWRQVQPEWSSKIFRRLPVAIRVRVTPDGVGALDGTISS